MTWHERQLVAFFLNPRNYPHAVGSIRHRQTHISHVFLAGKFAYKVKKPVRFTFLDASTMTLRKKWCNLEIHLNRRLAPSMYLGVVPVSRTRNRLRFGKKGKIIEWAVQMRRLPENRMLNRMISKKIVSRADIRRLITQLAVFFRRASRTGAIQKYGMPTAVKRVVFENLRECRPYFTGLLSEKDQKFLDSAFRQYFALHEPIFKRRVRERRIIDGHGDLRCENICLTDPVTVFDCVEFKPAFRRGDIANDLAFLLMDFEVRKRADLAETALNTLLPKISDPTLKDILPFYKCHRSLVRGKVRALEWLREPKTWRGKHMRSLARRHFQLATYYARQFAPPLLVGVGGLVGTGKTALSKGLADRLGAMLLRTDEIRRKEFVSSRNLHGRFNEGLYSQAITQKVYQRLILRAEHLIRDGCSVVCDGTFLKNPWRTDLCRIARRYGAVFHFFECVIPRPTAIRRLTKRYAAGFDLSQAKPEYYDRLRSRFEPVRGFLSSEYTRISTKTSLSRTLSVAVTSLIRDSSVHFPRFSAKKFRKCPEF